MKRFASFMVPVLIVLGLALLCAVAIPRACTGPTNFTVLGALAIFAGWTYLVIRAMP